MLLASRRDAQRGRGRRRGGRARRAPDAARAHAHATAAAPATPEAERARGDAGLLADAAPDDGRRDVRDRRRRAASRSPTRAARSASSRTPLRSCPPCRPSRPRPRSPRRPPPLREVHRRDPADGAGRRAARHDDAALAIGSSVAECCAPISISAVLVGRLAAARRLRAHGGLAEFVGGLSAEEASHVGVMTVQWAINPWATAEVERATAGLASLTARGAELAVSNLSSPILLSLPSTATRRATPPFRRGVAADFGGLRAVRDEDGAAECASSHLTAFVVAALPPSTRRRRRRRRRRGGGRRAPRRLRRSASAARVGALQRPA